MAGLTLLGLVLALGDSTLLYRGLQLTLPGLGFVRYPVKFVILVLALVPLLAAFGLTALTAGSHRGRFEITLALLMLLIIGAIVAWESRFPLAQDAWRATWQSGLSRAVFLGLAVLLAAAWLTAEGRRRILLGCSLVVLFWLDFLSQTPTQNPGANPSIYAPGWARGQLKLTPDPKPGESRVMTSPEALKFLRQLPPAAGLEETYLRNRRAIRVNCNLLDDLPQIDGFFSLTPREVSRVTALPYDHPAEAFPGLLDFLGVSQRTSPGSTLDWTPRPTAMPLITIGQQPVFANDRTTFDALSQTNLDLGQAVFLPLEARESISAAPQTAARVLDARFSNRRVWLQTEAPAASMVVVSQTYYPAWKAYIDGQPIRIWRANYAFQALQVPAGRHQVQLVYKDSKLLAGAVLSGLGLLACAGLWARASYRAAPAAGQPGGAFQEPTV